MALHGLTHWGVAKRLVNGFGPDRWFESSYPSCFKFKSAVKSLLGNTSLFFRPDFTFKSNLLSNGFIFVVKCCNIGPY